MIFIYMLTVFDCANFQDNRRPHGGFNMWLGMEHWGLMPT